MAVALLKSVATAEWGMVIHAEVGLYTVSWFESQYHSTNIGVFWVCVCPVCREVSAEHGVTMQAVVETNILKLHSICSSNLACVYFSWSM